MGDVRVADDEKLVYINKIGVMGGGTTVGNPGDKLTGNKVGIMGGDEPPKDSAPPSYAEPEPAGDVIYTKDSTPPAYKPNGEPYAP